MSQAPPSPRRTLPAIPPPSPDPAALTQSAGPSPTPPAARGHSRNVSSTSTISGIPYSPNPSSTNSAQPSRYLRRIPVPSPDGAAPSSATASPTLSAPRMSRQGSGSHSSHDGVQRSTSALSRGHTPTNDLLATPKETTLARFGSPSPVFDEGGRATPTALDPPRSTSSQQQYYLPVDQPTSNMLPSYPPPPPPSSSKPEFRHTSTNHKPTGKKKAVGKEMSKKELYLRHKHQLGQHRPAELGDEDEEEGVVPFPNKNRISADNELSPLLSSVPSTTWSLDTELDFIDLPKNKISKSRLLGQPDVEPFSVDGLPSTRRMWEAGLCEVQDQEGRFVPFGELIKGDQGWRTAVFFIRHFWCGQCQDYMGNSIPELDVGVLERHKIRVVIISNGHWQIIKKYRELFNCPFPLYVDGPRRLYNYLGMTLLNNDFGSLKQADRSRYNVNTVPGQLVRGIGNGLFRMPLRAPGKLVQLGGEFVFSNSSTCLFAHRMQHTSDHLEAVDVLAEAGVDPEEFFPSDGSAPSAFPASKGPLTMDKAIIAQELEGVAAGISLVEEERQEAYERDWEIRREAELERMRRAKEDRRAGRRGDGGSASASPATTPVVGTFADVGDVFRRRGEMDDDDDDDDDDDERDERSARAWTEEEQLDALGESMSCVRVVDDRSGSLSDDSPPGEFPGHRPREDSSATTQTMNSEFQGFGSGEGGGSSHRSSNASTDGGGGLGGSRRH